MEVSVMDWYRRYHRANLSAIGLTRVAGGTGRMGTGGGVTGTTGGNSGTNGARFGPVFAFIVVFTMMIITVNITSHLIEMPGMNPVWPPFTWELSSAASLFMLCPVLFRLYHRFPLRRDALVRFLIVHIGLWMAWTVSHVALMVVFRKVVYAIMGMPYDFSHGHLPLEMLYEGRKDLISYCIYIGIFWVADRLNAQGAPPVRPQRIEVRADGRVLYFEPAEILWVEAAGNYVELHVAGRASAVLVRGTLAEYEKRLGDTDFVRIHRSRLLNRSHIRQVETTHSGDVTVTLSDGRAIAGSRRYREGLGQ